MENNNHNTPKDVFLHLFNIFTFYLSIIAFITLLIQYINKLFPDALSYYDNISNSVTWASSVLFISIPFFIFTTWLLEKDIQNFPEKKELHLRRWLLYFTLFLSAITVIIDLMVFVYNFLQGELTIRFFLKVLVVLLVAGAVFAYYMWDLKRIAGKTNLLKILAITLLVVVFGSIVAGFFIVGTPKDQRNQRFDEVRIRNLSSINNEIVYYWQQKEKLPVKLTDLKNDMIGFYLPTDPETNESYTYNVKSDLTYELCANFKTELKLQEAVTKTDYYSSNNLIASQNWEHSIGYVCFEKTIDPDLSQK